MGTDLEKIIEQLHKTVGSDLESLVKQLKNAAEEEKERAERYKGEAFESKEVIESLNKDKKEAKERVMEAEKKAKAAEKLRDNEFASAISALFEKPQKELENFTQVNMVKLADETREQSHNLRTETRTRFKQGFWISIGILCLSITISFVISSYFGKQTSQKLDIVFGKMLYRIEGLEPLVEKTTTSITRFEDTLEKSFEDFKINTEKTVKEFEPIVEKTSESLTDFKNNIAASFSNLENNTEKAFRIAEKEFSRSADKLFDEKIKSLNSLLKRVDNAVDTIDKRTSEIVKSTNELNQENRKKKTIAEKVEDILQYITQNKDVKDEITENFPNYKTDINDLKLLYILKLQHNFSPCNYSAYIHAFKSIGISENIRPQEEEAILKWDKEFYNLTYAGFYISYIKQYNDIEFRPESKDHCFSTFKTSSSKMKYGSWQYSKVTSYQQLKYNYQTGYSKYSLNQIKYNKRQYSLDEINEINYTIYDETTLNTVKDLFKNVEILSEKENGDYKYSKGVILKIPIDNIECFLTFEERRSIQIKLNEKGFIVGDADGIIGTNTRTQIKEFNRKNKLHASDYVSKKFYKKLFKN